MFINKYQSAILFVLLIIFPKLLFSQASFSFSLNSASRTSAGVYKSDGTLVKTLWNGVNFNAGTYKKVWDGTDEDGKLVAEGDYQVKLLTNNVKYDWEGVIGNTSDALTGTTIHAGYHRIHALTVVGSNVFVAKNYSEGSPAQYKFLTSSPQKRQHIMKLGEGTGQETLCVDADDNYVYWGGVDPFDDNNSFIFATKVADNAEVLFSAGTAVSTKRGRKYPKAINIVNKTSSWINSLAVQKTGNYLFASRKGLNSLYVINKTTGALVKTLTYPSVENLAIDKSNNLWVHYISGGKQVVEKFKVNTDGSLSKMNVFLPNIVLPQALAVSYDGNTIVVADGGSSQQLKGYNNSTGASSWVFGKEGGYSKDATVANDKFYFDDPIGNVKGSSIAFQSDGSFWVVDSGNNRAQHYSSNRTFIDRIMYMPHFYSATVDRNDPTRVFANYLEFKVDYSKPLASNNGSWSLVKNWGYNIPPNLDDKYHRLRFTSTLSNGRTYALQKVGGIYNRWHVVELVEGGTLRFTNVIIQNINAGVQMYPDGSLRRISTTNVGSPVQFIKAPLTGFTSSHNPIWGKETVLATSPVKTDKDPLYWGSEIKLNSGEVTSTDLLISFDGGLPSRGSSGYHLGAIKIGDNKWLWKTAKSTSENYSGPYPPDGSYDIGNGAQYGGSAAMVMDRNIFWGYHGEFWKSGQTNKWNHVYDNGLLVGQFGTTSWNEGYAAAAPGMAGNAFAAQIIKDAAGNIYLYHNDEGHHGGVHRWKVTGLNTIQEKLIPIGLTYPSAGGLLGQYYDKNDLNNLNIRSTRIDQIINFNWASAIPASTGISNATSYAVNWTGFVKPLYSQAYTFYTNTSGGVRMWVDGKLLVDKKTNTTKAEFSGTVTLSANQQYPIRIEYYKASSSGSASLYWSSPSQAKQIIPTSRLIPAKVPDISEGVDLLEGLQHGDKVLENNMYGWTRNPTAERYNDKLRDWWTAKTGSMSFEKTKSPDLYVKFRQKAGTYTIARDLGTNSSLTSWKLSSVISLSGLYGNTTQAGMYIEMLDASGKIISRFYTFVKYGDVKITTVYGNTKEITKGTENDIFLAIKPSLPLDISASSAGITFKYGSYKAVTAPVFDATANWKSPKTFRLYFFTNGNYNLDRIIDIEELRFLKNSGTTSSDLTLPPVTITSDDSKNTLTASHLLTDSEILVSENNSPFISYSGAINVGNIARPAGYWKFKIKMSDGSIESAISSSPAFTATTAPIPAVPGILGNDVTNTLSATHPEESVQIMVSENGGVFTAYKGPISVGNIEREAGYWKFKSKSSTTNVESAVVNSPAFTVASSVLCEGTGKIIMEHWNNIKGAEIANIPVSQNATSTKELTEFEIPVNSGDNFATRIRGYICPPVTGNYTFWISGDDKVDLYLSNSSDPTKKVRIAYSTNWTGNRGWEKYSTQKSKSISLTKGNKYYIEALHKESYGGDNLAVGWQIPDADATMERPILGKHLIPFTGNSNLRVLEGIENDETEEIVAFPNPFSEELSIDLKMISDKKVKVDLYNNNGIFIRQLYEGAVEKNIAKRISLDGSNLINGMYFIKLIASDKILTKKIILSRP